MADYSIWALNESEISLTGGVGLDGVTQGDGSHLVGEFLTINSQAAYQIDIRDAGSDINFADNDGNQRLDGDQVIDGTLYTDGTRIEAEYEFVLEDPSTGDTYRVVSINVRNSSPAYGTVEALAFIGSAPPTGVALEVISAREGPRNNGSTAIDSSDIVPICFTAGTRIQTDKGLRVVERLKSGDMIQTQDNGLQPLRVLCKSKFTAAQISRNSKLWPIKIAPGALGKGLPERAIKVSRQHRFVVRSRISQRMFSVDEVLVAAHRLIEMPKVEAEKPTGSISYYHLILDRHEVVFAEGTPTESFFAGPMAKQYMSEDAWDEACEIFPDFCDMEMSDAARHIPAHRRQRRLVERHIKNAKPLVA